MFLNRQIMLALLFILCLQVSERQGGTMERKIICNKCGRELKVENGILKEDAFEARKEWGYFSGKDMTMHSFVICEDCYDRMIQDFVVPVSAEIVNEL